MITFKATNTSQEQFRPQTQGVHTRNARLYGYPEGMPVKEQAHQQVKQVEQPRSERHWRNDLKV